MRKVNALVLTGNGTNCEKETAHACRRAGADRVDIVYIWDLVAGRVRLADYNFLLFPGGFMDGDDLGAAKACAHRFRHTVTPQGENLFRALQSFVSGPRLVLGICNGFQLLVKLGLIPAVGGVQIPQATVWANDSGRFEDRWVHLAVDPDSPCVFTRGLVGLELPVRHGEGKVIFANPQVGAQVVETNAVPLRYVDPQSGLPTETYPHNPNGSKLGIAALCDETGRIFGLMPHPEAFVERTHHPQWTRRELDTEGAGLALFRNAVRWLRRNGP